MNESNQVVSFVFGFTPCSSGDIELPYYSTEITTSSSPYAVALAKHLNSIGAKMYGAFWCSHCLEQKEVGTSFIIGLPGLESVFLKKKLICDVHVSPLSSIDVWKRSSKVT